MKANIKVAVYRDTAPRFEEQTITVHNDVTLTQLAGICVNSAWGDDHTVTRVELISIEFLGEGAPFAERQ